MSLTRLIAALPEPLFSQYGIERVLGVGAYAVVYQVRDKSTDEMYALKVVEKEPMRVRLMLPQLEREAALLQEHADTPHVVDLLEVTTTRTHVFMRFDLCQQSVEDMVAEDGPMSEEDAYKWLRQACLGVQGLHSCGCIHRDLKPSNFLIDASGNLRVCDFGWACYETDELTGQCGTPQYSPPETAKEGRKIKHTTKVDIYGLAASFQHFLLGRVPNGPDDLPKGLSSNTKKFLAELMHPDPDQRPTIEELLERPELEQNFVVQVLDQMRSFFSSF